MASLSRSCWASALLLSILYAPSSGSASSVEDPWTLLGELRDHLAAGPLSADFVQTFTPAGFTTGDRESGQLFLALPDCVRWEYQEPYPKTFLLCQETLYTWNPGDQAGRRFRLADSDEPGIDFLRLQLDDLRRRYEAHLDEGPAGQLEVILTPRASDSTIVEARLTTNPATQELSLLTYRDLEGNVSEFRISEYGPFVAAQHFEPPSDLQWLDQ